MNTTKFFAELEKLRERNPGGVAKLRRSLSEDPGNDPDVFPYVEPWVAGEHFRTRSAAYLVAGLWAAYGRKSASGNPVSVAESFKQVSSSSGEARFIALLDADSDELSWRLRQAVALVAKESRLDWAALLDDVIRWDSPARHVQQQWAREYYKKAKNADTTVTEKE